MWHYLITMGRAALEKQTIRVRSKCSEWSVIMPRFVLVNRRAGSSPPCRNMPRVGGCGDYRSFGGEQLDVRAMRFVTTPHGTRSWESASQPLHSVLVTGRQCCEWSSYLFSMMDSLCGSLRAG